MADWVMDLDPDGWDMATQEQKAVSAIAPFYSLSMLLKGDTDFPIGNIAAAHIIKALVDRAELMLGIPGQSVVGATKEDLAKLRAKG